MVEEEWEDPPATASSASRPLPSSLVCVYVNEEGEALQHASVQGDCCRIKGVVKVGSGRLRGRGGEVQGQVQASVLPPLEGMDRERRKRCSQG